MNAKTPLSGDELRNALHLDILHDTNVSDRHIEKLVSLIEQEVTRAVSKSRFGAMSDEGLESLISDLSFEQLRREAGDAN